MCKADATSSLGGRCVSSSRRIMSNDSENYQACTTKCPGNKICDCIGNGIGCLPSIIASACRNKDHLNCLLSDTATHWVTFDCPIYECIVDGHDDIDDIEETSNQSMIEEIRYQ